MLLERMDIEAEGARECVPLGPFSPRLNAVYSPTPTGKRSLIDVVRALTVGTPHASSGGRRGGVVWADHDGLLYCRTEPDGSSTGRRTVELLARDGRVRPHLDGKIMDRDLFEQIAAASDGEDLEALIVACRRLRLDATPRGVDEAELRRSIAAIDAELVSLSAELVGAPEPTTISEIHRRQFELAEQRRELLSDLGRVVQQRCAARERDDAGECPLAQRASYWLRRLSEGTLSRIDWQIRVDRHEALRSGTLQGSDAVVDFEPIVRLDLRGAAGGGMLPTTAERRLAHLAVRMAAIEAAAQSGRPVPLLWDDPTSGSALSRQEAWQESAAGRRPLEALVGVLADLTKGGHQVIVLSADLRLIGALESAGARTHALPTPRTANPVAPVTQNRLADLNRALDTVWREANGLYDHPHWHRTTLLADGEEVVSFISAAHLRAGRPASPYFLNEQSPLEQAPSIDALSAARLRGVGLTRVGQLLACQPTALAARLALPHVAAETVRRWQCEAQLVCRVPQLRSFDARVLVGCGIRQPEQLAALSPSELLERVEAFLTTEQGRETLHSGSREELSRLTRWIATANRSLARADRHAPRSGRTDRRAAVRRVGRLDHERHPSFVPAASLSSRHPAATLHRSAGKASAGTPPRRHRFAPLDAAPLDVAQLDIAPQAPPRSAAADRPLRFLLDATSSIAAAPSIGPRAAQRLQRIGIRQVADLLQGDPRAIAKRLRHRRVTAETVRCWQRQATLVCGVPRLRSRAARLLVAAGIADPESLALCDPPELLAQLEPVFRSAEGKRILRGGKPPRLAEVTAWIRRAAAQRPRRAA